MVNRSEILRSAWAAYRRDDAAGFVRANGRFARKGAFDPAHFAYNLRMAWAIAKTDAAKVNAVLAERMALITEAGRLNNHPALVNVDHVTFMGLMDVQECRTHVAKLKGMIRNAEQPAATKARINAIREELVGQEYAERIDWHGRTDLLAELARLTA